MSPFPGTNKEGQRRSINGLYRVHSSIYLQLLSSSTIATGPFTGILNPNPKMPEQYNNGLRNKFDWYRQATSANDLGLNSTTGRSSTSRRPSPKYKHPETVPSSVNEGVSRQRSRYDVPPTSGSFFPRLVAIVVLTYRQQI